MNRPVFNDRQRYMGIVIYNYDEGAGFGLDLIENAARNGCNLVEVCIHWDKIYPTRNGGANWRNVDAQVKRALELGMQVGIRIKTARAVDRLAGFWGDQETQQGADGSRLFRGYATHFSFAHQPTLDLAKAFVREVTEHYQYLQQQNRLLFMSVVSSPIMEGEYSALNQRRDTNEEYFLAFDYSASMLQGFREWLRSRFTLSQLNSRWGSDFTNWDAVSPPPVPSYSAYAAFNGTRGQDWYVFRHLMFKRYFDETTRSIKGVNGGILVVNQHGSSWDTMSGLRGTYAFKSLGQNADGVKLNDSPDYNSRWSMDVVRSNIRPGGLVCNELDGWNNTVPLELLHNQIEATYAHGANIIIMANFNSPFQISRLNALLQRVRSRGLLSQPVPVIQPTVSMSYKLSTILRFGVFESNIMGQWNQLYQTSGQRPIRVDLVEDLLDEVNIEPKVAQPLPTQTATVGQSFRYEIPTANFTDADGHIARVEVSSGLPANGLSASNNVISGTPTAAGTLNLTVRATDNRNASVTTPLRINIVNQATNQPPVVNQAISDQTVRAGQSWTFQIPDNAFRDPDGQISAVDVSGLPSGLTYNATTRTISGTPNATAATAGASAAQVSTITVRATDNRGASVTQSFQLIISVDAPTNQPPVVAQGISNQSATVGQAFSLVIPAGTFTDPENQPLTLTVSGLPAGLSFNPNNRTISGTPNAAATATVTVRATDDKGASVSTTFTLTVQAAPQTGGQFTMLPPLYDCKTGRLELRVSGGDGSPIEFMGIGLTPWTTERVFTVPAYQLTGVPFLLKARQNGREVSFEFVSACQDTPTPEPPANRPPVVAQGISNQTATVGQAFSLVIPAGTFTDPENQPLTLTVSGLPAGLSFNPNNRTISGTPNAAATATVTVRATDDKGASVTTTFTLTVQAAAPTNQPPVVAQRIADQTATVGQAFSLVIPAGTFTDPENQPLTLAVSGLPAGLSYSAGNRTISGTPTAAATATVTVRATDDKGASVTTTFTLTVQTASQPPVTPPITGQYGYPEGHLDGADCGKLWGWAADRNQLNTSIWVDIYLDGKLIATIQANRPRPDVGAYLNSNGLNGFEMVLPENLRTPGPHTIEARFAGSDRGLNTSSRSFTCEGTPTPQPPANRPPVVAQGISNQTATVGQAFSLVIPAGTFTDPENQPLTLTVSGLPAGLSFNPNNRTISGTPTATATATVTVRATDDKGASVTTTFTLTVQAVPQTPTNQPPVVAQRIADQTATVGQAFSLVIPTGTFTDPENQPLTLTVSGLPAGLSYSAGNRTISGTPNAAATATVTVRATDDKGASVTTTFTLTVQTASQPPVTPPITGQYGYPEGHLDGADCGKLWGWAADRNQLNTSIWVDIYLDGKLIATIQANRPRPDVGAYLNSNGLNGFEMVLPENLRTPGPHTIEARFAGSDRGLNTSSRSFTCEGTPTPQPPANRPPVVAQGISNQTATVGQAFSLVIPAGTFTDPENQPLTLTVSGLPAGLSFNPNNRTISGTPTATATATVTVRATDDKGASVTTTFTLTVQAVPQTPTNQPPVVAQRIADQTATVGQAFSLVIPAGTFTDPENQPLTLAVSGLPAGLSYSAGNRTISGTPTAAATATVTVRATDDKGASVTTTFTLTVQPAPQTGGPLTMLAPLYDCRTGRLEMRVSGGDGSLVEYMGVGITGWTTNPVHTIDSWLRRGITFELRARQGSQTVTLSYTTACSGDNRAPTALSPIGDQTIIQGQSYSFSFPDSLFTDPDGDALTLAVRGLPVGMVFNPETRTISGTPSLIGVSVVTIEAKDPEGASISLTFRLIVQAPRNNSGGRISASSSPAGSGGDTKVDTWKVSPNPTNDGRISVVLPTDEPAAYAFTLVEISNRFTPLPAHALRLDGNVAHIDLNPLNLPQGLYFLRVTRGATVVKTIKFLKQ